MSPGWTRAAVAAGRNRTDDYSRDGVHRRVSTKVTPYKEAGQTQGKGSSGDGAVKPISGSQKICRLAETTVDVDGKGEAALEKQLYCRTPSGDWEPAAPKTT